MGTIAMLWNQETGKFEGIAVMEQSPDVILGGLEKTFKALIPKGVPAYQSPPKLREYNWIQNEHVEFYHKAKKSICSIHLMCTNYKWC